MKKPRPTRVEIIHFPILSSVSSFINSIQPLTSIIFTQTTPLTQHLTDTQPQNFTRTTHWT
jgi:hypothetical protein